MATEIPLKQSKHVNVLQGAGKFPSELPNKSPGQTLHMVLLFPWGNKDQRGENVGKKW